MTDLNFDLNIYSYSISELKAFLFIDNSYNVFILTNNINELKRKINSLQLCKKEKTEFNIFINEMEIKLIKDLEKVKKKGVQEELHENIKNLKIQIENIKNSIKEKD
mgnify:CR=1 FL=1|tara:strand:+ start:1673 stop:1993 length:321 start_codon:yes stop_codon:yes gene_type:complete